MLDTQTQTKEFDPFASASNPVQRSYDFWGKVDLSAWAGALVKGQGRVPYNPADSSQKRLTMIDIYIQPLVEIDVKYPKTCEDHSVAEFAEWAKITLPSIKDAYQRLTGHEIGSVREVNGMYARIARVPNGKKYEKKDRQTGQPTGEYADETTFKFVTLFVDEEACRADYFANGGQPITAANGNGHNVPTTEPILSPEDNEKKTAMVFLKPIVQGAVRGTTDFASAKNAVAQTLPQHTPVAKFFNAESIEVWQLITEYTGFMPF